MKKPTIKHKSNKSALTPKKQISNSTGSINTEKFESKSHEPKQYRFFLIFGITIQTCLIAIIVWLYINNLQHVQLLQQNQTTINKLEEQLNKQQADIDSLKVKIEKNNELALQKKNYLSLLKSYIFVQAAKITLITEKTTNSTLSLLEKANQNLATIDDQATIKIREAIENSIHELRMTKNIDINSSILQINSLQNQLTKLDSIFAPLKYETKTNPTAVTENKNIQLSRWQTFIKNTVAVFQTAFIIKQKQQTILPLLNIEQRESLIFGFQNKLELAKWALLNRQQSIFQNNIQQILDALQQYHSQFISAQLTSLEMSLKELLKIDLSLNLPNLDNLEQIFEANFTKG